MTPENEDPPWLELWSPEAAPAPATHPRTFDGPSNLDSPAGGTVRYGAPVDPPRSTLDPEPGRGGWGVHGLVAAAIGAVVLAVVVSAIVSTNHRELVKTTAASPSRSASPSPSAPAPPTARPAFPRSLDGFANLCSGHDEGYTGAAPYATQGPHPLIAFGTGGTASEGKVLGGSGTQDTAQVQLIACVEVDPSAHPGNPVATTCPYTDGKVARMLWRYYTLTVYESHTGRTVGTVGFRAERSACPIVISYTGPDLPDQYTAIESDKLETLLASFTR